MIFATWATAPARSRSNLPAMISRFWASTGALALALAGCTASSEDVRPPEGELFFPTGLATSPNDEVLFSLSANSDLRYDSGTINAINVDEVHRAILEYRMQVLRTGCSDDRQSPGAIECDEAPYFFPGAGVRIGNFAAALGVQSKPGSDDLRVLVPVRGDPSVTWADWDDASRDLACGGGDGFELCSDDHRLTRMREDEDLPELVDEPYGIYVDSVSGVAAVTHLSSGTVSLVDTPAAGTPVLADAVGGLFNGNGNARPGATGISGRLAGEGNIFYVQSRTEDRIQMLTFARQDGGLPFIVPSSHFFLNGVGGLGGASSDSRGVAFDPTGDRAYMLNRSPPSLMIYDTSLDVTGAPSNQLLGVSDVCRDASALLVADGGIGERAFITCFSTGELYVIDPRGASSVEAVIPVGRAPFGMAVAETRQLLFVSTFLEDSIAVVDLDPSSSTFYRVVMRIGVRS